jgi:hypothetical protein
MIWKVLYLIALFGYPAALVLGKYKEYKVEQGWSEIWVYAFGLGVIQVLILAIITICWIVVRSG